MPTFLDSFTNLFLGATCAGCHAEAALLCAACRRLLGSEVPHPVTRAGLDIPVIAANDYRPLVSRLVPRFKDEGALLLGRLLAARLGAAVGALAPPTGTALVPVASLPASVRRRGTDHCRRLAAIAARELRMPLLPLLSRRGGQSQRWLSGSERGRNAAGAMTAVVHHGWVVVCDDVVTTGSSLREATRALREGGARVVGAAVIGDADTTRGMPTTPCTPRGYR